MKYLLWSWMIVGLTLLVINAPSKPPSAATQQSARWVTSAHRIPIDPKRWYQVVNTSV